MYLQVDSSYQVEDTYFLWRSRGAEPASANQEGVRLGFALLDIRVVAKDYMVEAAEELLVLARLQLKRCPLRTCRHGNWDVVLLQMVHQSLNTFNTVLVTKVNEGTFLQA